MHVIEKSLLNNISLESAKCLNEQPQTFKSTSSLIVAYSGGLDSTVLLHCAWRLYHQKLIELPTALHVNHGLQLYADDWQLFCQKTCNKYQIPLLVKSLYLSKKNTISEEEARDARYQFFKQTVNKDQLIALAHHRDDQVETVLFRLFRGTGIQGVKGIPNSRKIGVGKLIRPLLNFSRKDLENYAKQNKLKWVDDPSNQTNQYDRNFIRNRVVPLLHSKWPSVSRSLINFSKIASEQTEILEAVARQDLALMERSTEIIQVSLLLELSVARQKNLLHYWVRVNCDQSPATKEIEEILRQLELPKTASNDGNKSIKVKAGIGWVRSFNGNLFYCSKNEPKPIDKKVVWENINQKLQLDNGLILSANAIDKWLPIETLENLQLRFPDDNEIVTVRPRVGGEKVKPIYRSHSTSLKKLYQELNIPVWKRKWLPLIYYNEQLVAVPGIFIEKSVQIKHGGLIFNIT